MKLKPNAKTLKRQCARPSKRRMSMGPLAASTPPPVQDDGTPADAGAVGETGTLSFAVYTDGKDSDGESPWTPYAGRCAPDADRADSDTCLGSISEGEQSGSSSTEASLRESLENRESGWCSQNSLRLEEDMRCSQNSLELEEDMSEFGFGVFDDGEDDVSLMGGDSDGDDAAFGLDDPFVFEDGGVGVFSNGGGVRGGVDTFYSGADALSHDGVGGSFLGAEALSFNRKNDHTGASVLSHPSLALGAAQAATLAESASVRDDTAGEHRTSYQETRAKVIPQGGLAAWARREEAEQGAASTELPGHSEALGIPEGAHAPLGMPEGGLGGSPRASLGIPGGEFLEEEEDLSSVPCRNLDTGQLVSFPVHTPDCDRPSVLAGEDESIFSVPFRNLDTGELVSFPEILAISAASAASARLRSSHPHPPTLASGIPPPSSHPQPLGLRVNPEEVEEGWVVGVVVGEEEGYVGGGVERSGEGGVVMGYLWKRGGTLNQVLAFIYIYIYHYI